MVEDGYEFFADRGLVTVFSAPNYCGEFDNCGAMMTRTPTPTPTPSPSPNPSPSPSPNQAR